MKKLSLIPLLLILFALKSNSQDLQTSKTQTTLSTTTPMISVTIGGAFIINGSFSASPNERVDQFISRILLQQKSQILNVVRELSDFRILQEELERYAKRDIKLKRITGEEIIVDLDKFHISGDFKYNPYLKNDDVIIFPKIDIDRDFVSVDGAINNRVKFQFVKGDKLSDAIAFAGGTSEAYEGVEEVQISRLDYTGDKENLIKCKVSDDFLLERGDRIFVVGEESQKKEFRVFVTGEVNRPGYIPITKNTTTLYEVIKRAGGFKPTADLNRAELLRGANVFKSVVFSEKFENLMMRRMANLAPDDSLTFLVDNALRFSRGNGIIDFNKLNSDTTVESKFIVKDGDFIFVPEKLNLVYIFGQVYTPGYVAYEEGKDVFHYIEKAGGIGDFAKDEIYLIKGKTRSWIQVDKENKIDVDAGDYIWIPKEPPKTFSYYLDRTTAIGSVVGALATVLLLIVQLTKP